VKKIVAKIFIAAGLIVIATVSAQSQTINETVFVTTFWDSTYTSTFDSQPLPIGSLIQAFDSSGVYCGVDTVRFAGAFGFMTVYGDDPQSSGLDEGAVNGETITFKINGRNAVVNSGDPTWAHMTQKSISLSASSTIVAMTAISLPTTHAIQPGDTAIFRVDVRNDGDGIDFYSVALTMSVDDTIANPGVFNWEKLLPDSVVYANAGDTAAIFFSIRTPSLNADTLNTINYKVYSNLDTTVFVTGSVDLYFSLTDVKDPYSLGLPGSFALNQNYPNPFNPSTTISYDLTARANITLEVYDMLGRQVDYLDIGEKPAGSGEIFYDASDLASGIYFYRLTTDSYAKSKKMILIK